MSRPPLPELIRWVIWFALVSAVLLYFFIVRFTGGDSEPSESATTLKNPFYVIGLIAAIASLGVKHFVRSRSLKAGSLVPMADPAFIASLALAEAPAIFGLILGFQGASMSDYLPLFVLSLLALLMVNPKTFFPQVN